MPAPRIAWDRDGSSYWVYDSAGTPTELSASVRAKTNSELKNSTSGQYAQIVHTNAYPVVLFPRPMNLRGYFANCFVASATPTNIEVSSDTTTGQDGTWTTAVTNWQRATGDLMKPQYRSEIRAMNADNVKGVRFRFTVAGNANFHNLHLYGFPTNADNRLEFWHPTSDTALDGAHLDWGDRRRGTTETRLVRVKNLSSTLTANSIVVSIEALTDITTPSTLVSQHALRSPAGSGAYASTVNLGALAPGAISPQIEIEQALNIADPIGLYSQRLLAIPGSWT